MRSHLDAFLFVVFFIWSFFSSVNNCVQGNCLDDQRTFLTHLESLDLSRNNLTGKIPFQLASLSSLTVLNVSFNKLVGEIPSGGQFQTFESSSFQGNVGLCGFPLSNGCNTTVESPPNRSRSKDENASGSKDEFDWVLFVVTFLGFVLGAGMVIGPQYFWEKGRQWANKCINKILRIHY
ncbi:hypothetical protein MKX03_005005 [Papaver bracteatum]|nr:hypothetical protein MKX03_005005 [Papaver bracteatum]